jgi:hypothetical protein
MFRQTLLVLLGCIHLHVLTSFEPVDYYTKCAKKTIEQNKYVLCSWDSCDCNQMKIFKGK